MGGGNFITESYPTNFHTFATRRTLRANADINDYREVTEAEMAVIKEADAKWERPPQSFIDRWNHRCIVPVVNYHYQKIGEFNEATGYFELNGFMDIGYEEALEIDRLYKGVAEVNNMSHWFYGQTDRCRTLFPFYVVGWSYIDTSAMFRNSRGLKYIKFMSVAPSVKVGDGVYRYEIQSSAANAMFDACSSLETIDARIIFSAKNASISNMFRGCSSLKDVTIVPRSNIDFSACSQLSEASMNYMIANGEAGITITLHPAAYARVTDEMMALAGERQITIAST